MGVAPMSGRTRGRARAGRLLLAGLVTVVGASVIPAAAGADPSAAPVSPAATPRNAPGAKLTLSTSVLKLGNQRVGTFFIPKSVLLTNTGTLPISMDQIVYSSGHQSDFLVKTDCFPGGHPSLLKRGHSCVIQVVFTPRDFGPRQATISIITSAAGSPQKLTLAGNGTEGYFLAGSLGGVARFGDAVWHGDRKNRALSAPIISITTTLAGAGYWLLGADGGIFSFGNAKFYGSTGAMHLNRPVVGMASLRASNGYWLVAGDGGIFSFGAAKFHGSTGAMRLNQPIVGMAATRSGNGYCLVARDGGIFTFGDAKYYGSAGGFHITQPIVGMASTPSGRGYWLVANDGGIFAFGDARYFGSGAGKAFGNIEGMAITPDGGGYWMSNSVGQVFKFGDAPYFGDLFPRGIGVALGIAATAPTVRTKLRSGVIDESASSLKAHAVPMTSGADEGLRLIDP
jgi:hypothetical protein